MRNIKASSEQSCTVIKYEFYAPANRHALPNVSSPATNFTETIFFNEDKKTATIKSGFLLSLLVEECNAGFN